MPRADYFHDGYTQAGFIAAVPGLHGALRFSFRPALVEERSALGDASRRMSSPAFDRHLAQFLTDKLIDWDLVDAAARPVLLAAESLLRMHPELFAKLSRIVLGTTPTDIDPAWPAETQNGHLELEAEAALTGSTIGELREAHDEKN